MSMKYLIGVDGGSQSSKVVIFDLSGNIICEGRQELRPLHQPEPGVVEHPDDDLWDSIVIACRQAMARFNGDPKDIVGVGVCTIRCCRALMKKDGNLASPVLSWMDRRLARPYEHLDPAVAYVTTTSGYINHRFTGELIDTASNYIGEWPIDLDTWQWSEDPEVFRKYNVPRKMLFNLQMPGTISGHVTEKAALATGIPAGLPVVTTANDKAVEGLGTGLMSENTVLVSLGTYICGMAKGRRNVKDSVSFWTNTASVPNEYLYESGGIRRGMWTVSWFKELLGDDITEKALAAGISPEAYMEREAAQVPAGSDGLMTLLDWLAPPSELFRKGLMIGFDGRHGRGHMYRSILEAIALTMKNHTEAMSSELGQHTDRVIVSGGGSNSDLFMQIFADVFGFPAERNVVNGAAGLGAVICAAVATGVYENFPTAVRKMVRIKDVFQPVKENVDLYRRMNAEVFTKIRSQVEPILKASYEIFG